MLASTLDATAAAEHFFAGARDAGMANVVISPGSRSTPLAVAAYRTPGIATHVHIDERGAAFAALGQAVVLGTAVGLICTSGTAAANYLPAIAEASLSNVALVAITADRPPEHQHIGVGQTFDQRGLYHRQVRAEISMPVGADGGARHSQLSGWRAAATALELHGPVHVNWPFRLPLEPGSGPIDQPESLDPVVQLSTEASASNIERALSLLTASVHPIIVAGPLATPPTRAGVSMAAAIIDAAEHLHIPILADTLSGLRGRISTAIVPAPTLVVEGSTPTPDLILRVGNTPTSKATRLWWEGFDATHLLIDPLDDWQDASQLASTRLRCSAASLFTAVRDELSPFDPAWLEQWMRSGARSAAERSKALASTLPTSAAHVAAGLERSLSSNDVVVASSSMPVRDIDTFTSVEFAAKVVSNRGINGIDGVISTAIGVSRSSPGGRTLVYLGDIAALHDIGALFDAVRQGVSLTIVIPNDNGGAIFSLLPAKTSLDSNTFDDLFRTPHGTTFEFAAGIEGVHYRCADGGVAEALDETADQEGIVVIEIAVVADSRSDVLRAIAMERQNAT